jgi:tetratricopeptide (TPR) repeat protein
MAIEGRLEDVGLADICQLLAMGRKTGCLTVTDRSNFGYVYFDHGRVVYATVLNRPDRLGDLLVRNNAISRDDLSNAMAAQAQEPDKRLGQLLVERGALTQEQLHRFITVQIEESVYHLFTWTSGSFHFDPDQKPDEDSSLLVSINAESLLLEGARRVDEWSQIEKKISSMDLIFSLDRDPQQDDDVELTKEQLKVIPLLDGERTVEDVVRESGLVEFEVGKAIYGLIQAGYVQRTGRKEAETLVSEGNNVQQHLNLAHAYYKAGMLEDAEREYEKVVELDPAHLKTRLRLGLICLKGDRPRDALDHLDALPDEAIQSEPVILRNGALALELLERYEQALGALDRAQELAPDDRSILLSRAVLHFKARQVVRSHELFRQYRKLEERGGELPPMYYAYAILAAAACGREDEALAIGREGLTRHPGEGPILVNLGVVLERRGEPEAAEALYLRAVSEAPTPPQAHKNLGDLAYRRGDQAGARAHFERAVALDADLGDDIYLKLGNIAYKEGDRDWALKLWRRALELNPENEVVRTNLDLIGAAPVR